MNRKIRGRISWAAALAATAALTEAGWLMALSLTAGRAVHAVFAGTRGFVWGLGLVLLPGPGAVTRPLATLTRRFPGRWRGGPAAAGHLTRARARAESIDAAAAEMRRIERDLHDGAQARLVAMGMTLDAADQLMAANPAGARALLAEARASSARALAELRDLVRGIRPPVLADRGLAEAVRALALDLPLRANVSSQLAGRPSAPAESAAYFAVSELLANVSKHAGAGQAWIVLRHEDGALRVTVTDDGAGGADPARGTGLAGIERRLAAFGGVLALSSPPGGPTVASMEIPCVLGDSRTAPRASLSSSATLVRPAP